jgi:hypothetical protein
MKVWDGGDRSSKPNLICKVCSFPFHFFFLLLLLCFFFFFFFFWFLFLVVSNFYVHVVSF